MRYVHTNTDGSVALWATVPLRLVDQKTGVSYNVLGVRRRNGQCLLYGGSEGTNIQSGVGFEIAVGDDTFDISDLDTLPGYDIVWPDFEKDILGKLDPVAKQRYASHRRLARPEIPTSRTFRAAWEDTGIVAVNMVKAQAIQMDRIRALRDAELAKKDTEFMIALEKGLTADQQRIAAEKQVLRDIPTTFDLSVAKTPEELEVLFPPILTTRITRSR